jgi:AcrR family transcriptional regulator
MKRGRPALVGAEDWTEAALAALRHEGPGAVAVECLAQRLGVTKGSFYWHFANRDALLQAALTRWEAQDTTELLRGLAPIRDPRQRLQQLFVAAMDGRDAATFVPLSALVDDPIIRAVVDRVIAARLAFLHRIFTGVGLPRAAARHRALLTYSAYVGLLHLSRHRVGFTSRRDLARFVDEALATLLPSRRHHS